MTLGYANPAFAAPKDCVENDPRGGCNPKPGDDATEITYDVELTGAIVFDVKGLTPQSRNTVLKSAEKVTIKRDHDTMLETLWNTVFEQCPNFFHPTPVEIPEFTAPAEGKGWTIAKAGGIRVIFREILLFSTKIDGYVEVTLQLIGDTPFEQDFLPVGSATTITHTLIRFVITGKTAKGVTPRLSCNDGSETGGGNLTTQSILTITGPL